MKGRVEGGMKGRVEGGMKGGWEEGKGGGWDEGRVEVLTEEDRSIRKHSICIPLSHVTAK